jgi:Flp pilus assembly protein CpaB
MEVFKPQHRALAALGTGLCATILLACFLAARPETAPAKSVAALSRQQMLRLIPPGHRAIAVRCGAETAACGLAGPGCRVDLIGFADRQTSATILLEDALVLALDPTVNRTDRTVTVWLAVKVEATEQLVPVVSQSPVTLAVRRPGDTAHMVKVGESLVVRK